ncbi:hypothetical protein HAX54_015452 [Datura stramonium]|uniref:FBD domain-containing protein n=1 Tax=Datura stramonium TaxID=4076 RepID=A0ABS8TPW6_DATST|nr:hypothetical protein [Datura stramonium]
MKEQQGSFALNSVKRCYLFDPQEDSYILSHALSLIRSFPYLEYLKIEVYNDGDIPTEESLILKHLSDVTFNHLRKVKLQCFTGRTYELQLIALANSPVLLRMIIHREYPDQNLLKQD